MRSSSKDAETRMTLAFESSSGCRRESFSISGKSSFSSELFDLPARLSKGSFCFGQLDESIRFALLDVSEVYQRISICIEEASGVFTLMLHLKRQPVLASVGEPGGNLVLTGDDSFLLIPGANGTIDLHPGDSTRDLMIFISPGRLSSLIDEDGRNPLPVYQECVRKMNGSIPVVPGICTPLMHNLISQGIEHSLRSSMSGLYLGAKVLEILSLYMDQIFESNPEKPADFRISRPDRACLEEAMDIICREAAGSPMTIPILARRAGLNISKLKYGFRRLYGTTVHRAVTSVRMERAWELLSQGDHNVFETACAIGYRSQAAFSEAFKKEFGMLPSSFLRRNLK